MKGTHKAMYAPFLDGADQLGGAFAPEQLGLSSSESGTGIGDRTQFALPGGIKPQQGTEHMGPVVIDNVLIVFQARSL
jgi:hypothetical protein